MSTRTIGSRRLPLLPVGSPSFWVTQQSHGRERARWALLLALVRDPALSDTDPRSPVREALTGRDRACRCRWRSPIMLRVRPASAATVRSIHGLVASLEAEWTGSSLR